MRVAVVAMAMAMAMAACAGGSSAPRPDVLGSPEIDAAVLEWARGLEHSRNEQAAFVHCAAAGARMGATEGGDARKVQLQWHPSSGLPFPCAMVHTHVRQVGGSVRDARELERDSDGDREIVTRHGFPHYWLAPSGALRVLELRAGRFTIRELGIVESAAAPRRGARAVESAEGR